MLEDKSQGARGERPAAEPEFAAVQHEAPNGEQGGLETARIDRSSWHRISQEQIDAIMPLVREISTAYRLPIPTVGFADGNFNGIFEIQHNNLLFGYALTPDNLPSAVVHEMEHVAQSKLMAAAKLAHPDRYEKVIIHESIMQAAREQGLAENPLAVSVGEMFIRSRLKVQEASARGAKTEDEEEYAEACSIYRNSFEELTAEVERYEFDIERFEEDAAALREAATELRERPAGFLGLGGLMNGFRAWRHERQAEALDKKSAELRAGFQSMLDKIESRFLGRADPDFY